MLEIFLEKQSSCQVKLYCYRSKKKVLPSVRATMVCTVKLSSFLSSPRVADLSAI